MFGHGDTFLEIIADLVWSCHKLEGAATSGRNIQCWDEALTQAKSHQDIYLEAVTTHHMGTVAKQYG